MPQGHCPATLTPMKRGKTENIGNGRLLLGSCLDRLKDLPDGSIDSIVTDPPYELGFMGKAWDASGIAYNVELWRECLRVLKPGGHLLAFGGTRTYHRMSVAIEDAGFEIRDSIHWVYGSGFPKSLDVSKAIDKQRHDREDIYRVTAWIRAERDRAGLTNNDIDAAFGFAGMAGHWTSGKSQPAVPTLEQIPTLLNLFGLLLDKVPADIRRLLWDLNGKKGQPGENWAKRKIVGTTDSTLLAVAPGEGRDRPPVQLDITVPATNAAKQWSGWGTALKPAHEPIVVARKPLDGTVAANVLAHGTGALNIDKSRIGNDGGRWPANIVFTHAAECRQIGKREDTMTGGFGNAGIGLAEGVGTSTNGQNAKWVNRNTTVPVWACADGCPVATLDQQSDGASRFFTVTEWDQPFNYIAKPNKSERNAGLDTAPVVRHADRMADNKPGGNNPRNRTNAPKQNFHPTVKPVALMRWLVRLVTPTGGTVLDPFLGSGTTAMAAELENVKWVGCELTTDYLPIIRGRVKWAAKEYATGRADKPRFKPVTDKPKKQPRQPALFEGQDT